MTLELVLLVVGGIFAVLMGVFVFFFSPGRFGSSLTGAALALLGLEELAWARALHAANWGGENLWMHLSLAFALPVSLAWVLVAITLGRGDRRGWSRGWRVYLAGQALLSLAAVVLVHRFPPVGPALGPPAGEPLVPLEPFGRALLVAVLINVVAMTASFESTYLHLPLETRRAFRPGMLGILLLAGFQGYLIGSGLQSGRLSIAEMGLSGIPTAVVSLLLPLSLLRGRIAESSAVWAGRPVHKTATTLLTGSFLLAVPLLLLVTRATGLSLARGVLVFSIAGLGVGIGALAISNRLQRGLRHALDPYLYRPRVDEPGLWARLTRDLEPARTLEELYRLIPKSASEVAGIGPVTLYVSDRARGVFVPVASTIDPVPSDAVGFDDPLPSLLRRRTRPIHLQGRTDDLEYIPIYVENAKQIAACAAICAVPLSGEGELHGFLLCGAGGSEGERRYPLLSLLEVVARQCADRLEYLGTASGAGPSRS